jgi:mannose-6-phosphate isomerase-like protein (cupin superfamily)
MTESEEAAFLFGFNSASFVDQFAHGAAKPILASRVRDRTSDAESGGCRFIDLVVMPVGSEIGTHTHGLDDEEIYLIVDGVGLVTVDGESISVGSGDVIVNRPGGTHGLVNVGTSPLRLVVVDIHADSAPT